jgi:hypothetical protein
MTDKAIVRLRRRAGAIGLEEAAPGMAGLEVQHDTRAGTIVSGDREALDALAAAGARVKLLPDTNLIGIYDHVIGGPTTLQATVSGALYPGSVNAKVTVQGTTAAGVRFVRTTMRSDRIA